MDRRGRIVGIFLVMGLGFAAVAGRLVYLQVFERAELTARAEQQQESLITIEPKRGTIFDRMGRELAVSLDVDSIYGVPSAAKNPRLLARRLSPALHEDPRALERKFSSGRSFVWLSRKADPAKAERVKVLGLTSVDNEGLEGIEREYDKVLRGVSGRVLAEKDAFGRMVFPGGPGFQYTLPKAGKDVVLTIDEVIQHIAEKELDRALARAHAPGGVGLVMIPQTGELLALSVRTGASGRGAFNPNTPQQYRPAEWRNRAVTDAFEPGSIFKPVLAAAALEEKAVHPQERLDCSAGSIKVADRVIRDAHKNGVLTFTDVIAESSNVGTIKVSQRLGRERFFKYITAFGFGRKTGVDLPGEIPGLVKDYRLWSGVSIGSIAIGQEIGVTPLQMAAAYGAIANGGTLMKPYAVAEIVDRDGKDGAAFGPQPVGRVVSEETCGRRRKILQRVVGGGSVAAPAFRAVAEQSLAYLQAPPDDTGGRMLLVAR